MYETGYYRVIKEDPTYAEKGFVVGALGYAVVTDDEITFILNGEQYTYSLLDPEQVVGFETELEFAPDGVAERQQQIAALMAEINESNKGFVEAKTQLLGFSPHAEAPGETSSSTGLIPAGSGFQVAKKAVAELRNTIQRRQRDIQTKTKQLSLLMEEHTKALAIRAGELQQLLAKAEEAIWSINLYLGKNEEIHRLQKGKPAPAETKITLRQLVLYMDEECAIKAHGGGIDCTEITEFDNWLTSSPKHIQQLIPEDKAIVALHIRRHRHEYEDPWLDAALNKNNLHWTYFLIRNGENLYRVWVDIVLGAHMFPPVRDYTNLFSDRDETFKPGSRQYMKAMEAAEAKDRHQLRVLLVLQGLLDRTPIFKPMPVERINLCNPKDCEEFVQLVYDGENLLGDGSKPFSEWFADINSKIDIGHRIIGLFDWQARLHGDEKHYLPCRIYPRRATQPNSFELHTIESREGDHFIFRYARDEDVRRDDGWGRVSYGKTNIRARCYIERDDDFILNYDAATIDAIQYYLTSRLHRHEYQRMIPVLEHALKLKQQEQKEEAPFRKLLLGELLKAHKDPLDELEAGIEDLVHWWKFKNRTHRALTAKDGAAVKAIVAEYGLRKRRGDERSQREHCEKWIVDVIGAGEKPPLMIAHKKDNEYVAYVAENEQNIWVSEQLWVVNGQTGTVRFKRERRWTTVDKRFLRWQIIYQTDRWSKWTINPIRSRILSDPELTEIAQRTVSEVRTKRWAGRNLPLCITHTPDFKIAYWFSPDSGIIPTENLLSSSDSEPYPRCADVRWQRHQSGKITLEFSDGSSRTGKRPWAEDHLGKPMNVRVIQQWDKNIDKLDKERFDYRVYRKTARSLAEKYEYVTDLIKDAVYDARVAAVRAEYDAEHGDPEFWEKHLKMANVTAPNVYVIKQALELCAERYVEVIGRTVREVLNMADSFLTAEYAKEKHTEDEDDWSYGRKRHGKTLDRKDLPDDLPLDFVIPPPPPKNQLAKVDDDDGED